MSLELYGEFARPPGFTLPPLVGPGGYPTVDSVSVDPVGVGAGGSCFARSFLYRRTFAALFRLFLRAMLPGEMTSIASSYPRVCF